METAENCGSSLGKTAPGPQSQQRFEGQQEKADTLKTTLQKLSPVAARQGANQNKTNKRGEGLGPCIWDLLAWKAENPGSAC